MKEALDPLEQNWILAENLTRPGYIAFRTDKPLTDEIQSVLIKARNLTMYEYKEYLNEKKQRRVALIPHAPAANQFKLGLGDDTEFIMDLTGFAWWPLTDIESIREILKIWFPERRTAAEKKSAEMRQKQAEKAADGPSPIIQASEGTPLPISPALKRKVMGNLMKMKQGRS